MFTESSLRQHPAVIKAFMGVPAAVFWDLLEKIAEQLPAYEAQRLARADRQRALGGGRDFDQPLGTRVALVLTYLRLHIPQEVVAQLYGATQADVSRELRRLLPVLQAALPCPAVWQQLAEGADLSPEQCLELEQLVDRRALIDATAQRISRPTESAARQEQYSGKKSFTLKTQLVTDGEHHILAISAAVPGKTHDKKLSAPLQTLERWPDGCEAEADKGDQGLAAQVSQRTVTDPQTGAEHYVPRLEGKTPFKKPKGKELTPEQHAFNTHLSQVRVRIEHGIGWGKNWAIIATRFRCAHTIYTAILCTVCGLVNAQTQRWQAAKAANCA
jgi:hypothetical protein